LRLKGQRMPAQSHIFLIALQHAWQVFASNAACCARQ
jgi:hypothetical protein